MVSHRSKCKCYDTLVVVIDKGLLKIVGSVFEVLVIYS